MFDKNVAFNLIEGEAIHELSKIPDRVVDLVCVDLPYGVTNNKWDCVLPLDKMWEQLNRICKENAAMVFTATQPFCSILVMSNLNNFKYDIIWEKTVSSGQLNVSYQPMRSHESILIFYRKKPTYNEQKTEGTPYSIKRSGDYEDNSYNKQSGSEKNNDGFRHARSVIKVSNPRIRNGHPTQKPVELMDYIIKTYSNEKDIVIDFCMGSGTTGESAIKNNRKFIGIEKDSTYYSMSLKRINDAFISCNAPS